MRVSELFSEPEGCKLLQRESHHGLCRWALKAWLFWMIAAGFAGLVSAELPTASQDQEGTPPEVSIRVMSFNIRYGTADDGPNRWENRRALVVDTIRQFGPDLLGTQETLDFQRAWLDEHLPEFESHGVGRDDGKKQGEMTALWYRRERFELLDSGHFWLSEHPDQPGSLSWDSSLTRMASWVKLRDKQEPASPPVFFLNTHFDHRGEKARRESAGLILRMCTQLGEGCDWIVSGDFNASEGSPPYATLFAGDSPLLRDTYRLVHPQRTEGEGTFSGYKAGLASGPRIDWIGVSGRWQVQAAEINRTSRTGATPSDHFPVTTELTRAADARGR